MLEEEKTWPKRQLQSECKELSDRFLWNETLKKEVIYISPMGCSEWVALLMTRYNFEVVELIQTLPTIDRFFYQAKANRFKQLSIWCIREECSQAILEGLKNLSDIQLENLAENFPIHADHQEHQRRRSQNLF